MTYRIELLALSLALVVVAGCSHGPLQDGYGEPTANNRQAQVINPDAGTQTVPTAALDGQKAEKLLKGYRTDSGKTVSGSIIEVK